jgi:Arm DNA-binding domain
MLAKACVLCTEFCLQFVSKLLGLSCCFCNFTMSHPLSRAKKRAVLVQTRSGRLRLQLARQIYEGDRKYLYLNLPDTPENWELAQAKVQLIEALLNTGMNSRFPNCYQPSRVIFVRSS